VGATYTGHVTFLVLVFIFLFFNRATANTGVPIFAYNISKDAFWCKEEKCVVVKFGCGPKWAIISQNKMSNNFETVRDTRNMSMNHDYETGVALSDSVNKTCVKRPLAEKSRWRNFRLAIKARYLWNHASQLKITIERYQEVMVALLKSVLKNRLKRPLAEKSRWRHIRLAIKPRYLGNHASQIKRYWITFMKSCSLSNFYKRNRKY